MAAGSKEGGMKGVVAAKYYGSASRKRGWLAMRPIKT
jgi:hypothetical protein